MRNKSDEMRRLTSRCAQERREKMGGIVEHTMRMIDPSVIHGARRLSAGLS